MAELTLVTNNWISFYRPKIIKKLPGIWHNKGDRNVIAIRYSVRNRWEDNTRIWYLIRRDHAPLSILEPDSTNHAPSTNADGTNVNQPLLPSKLYAQTSR